MLETKKIVCLANSRKHSGRCFAGKEVLADGYGGWIRPVGPRPSAEISEGEQRCESGNLPKLLDVVEIPLLHPAPHLYQSENYVADTRFPWVKKDVLSQSVLDTLIDTPASLWPTGDSTYHGLNDRIRFDIASHLSTSLLLISLPTLIIELSSSLSPLGTGRRRVRAEFKYKGVPYRLVVTDPVAEALFLARRDGRYEIGHSCLCVSLSEAHTDGYCYKLAVGLIVRDSS